MGQEGDAHLLKFGTGRKEERHTRLPSDGPGEHRLSRSRRTGQQHTLGQSTSERRKPCGILDCEDSTKSHCQNDPSPSRTRKGERTELNNLLQLVLCLLDSLDVSKLDNLAAVL